MPFNGRTRKLVMTGERNGHFFVLDRTTGEHLVTGKFGLYNNWASGLDAQSRPKRNPAKDATVPGVHANVDHIDRGTAAADAHAAGAAPYGCLGMIGDVWEWTSSHFGGYRGFMAHPYREYSEVFFGSHYFVLRGGSWATSARIAMPTFRNWDYPQRRQIFAGIRVASDAV